MIFLRRKNIEGHLYKGYSLVSQFGEIVRSSKYSPAETTKNLAICFGKMDGNVNLNEFMEIPLVAATMQR